MAVMAGEAVMIVMTAVAVKTLTAVISMVVVIFGSCCPGLVHVPHSSIIGCICEGCAFGLKSPTVASDRKQPPNSGASRGSGRDLP